MCYARRVMPQLGPAPTARIPFQLLLRAPRGGEVLDGAAPATAALAAFREALQDDPTEADYHYMMGETLLRLGRAAEALPALREAARLQPENATYHELLGGALWEDGAFEDARAAFAEAVRLADDPQSSLGGLAVSLLQLDRPKEALEALQRARRRDTDDSRWHSNLGVALWALGRRGEALTALRRAAELSPEAVSIQRNLAQALLASDEREAALSIFREVLRLRPNDAHAHADMGDLLYAMGRSSEAEVAFEDALRLDPTCFRVREGSRVSRDTLMVERLKRELRAEGTPERTHAAERVADWLLGWAPQWRGMSEARRAVTAVGVLLMMIGIGRAVWALGPPYVTNLLFKDRMAEIARAPVRDDADVLSLLMHEVEAEGLSAVIGPKSFEITSARQWRQITCRYDVALRLLPGVSQNLHFEPHVEQPYFAKEPES